MALKTMIENLNKARAAYEAQLKTLGKDTAKAVAAELAPLIPEGCVLRWTQYTPYFNDGDACTFSVNEPQLCREDDDEGVDCSSFGASSYGKESWAPEIEGITRKDILAIEKAWKKLPEDLLESAFGDHTQVVVEPNGKYSVDEYSHD